MTYLSSLLSAFKSEEKLDETRLNDTCWYSKENNQNLDMNHYYVYEEQSNLAIKYKRVETYKARIKKNYSYKAKIINHHINQLTHHSALIICKPKMLFS